MGKLKREKINMKREEKEKIEENVNRGSITKGNWGKGGRR